MKKIILSLAIAVLFSGAVYAQTCTPQGDQTTYGTSDVWIGYVYNEMDLTTNYAGFVTEGVAGNSDFDQSFGGSNVDYLTSGCNVNTNSFSVRYKLTKTYNGTFQFTVGGDDGYRLSLDGGATWVIDRFVAQSYTSTTYSATLNGTYNMVLEYYENGGDNRVSFQSTATCMGTGDETIYGTDNQWNAYVYDGVNFDIYKGKMTEGNSFDPSFDENFGGSNATFNTNTCPVLAETFSVRYKLTKTFTAASYIFAVGGDDGYRLSLDGGATWVINNWTAHSYATSSYSTTLNGTYNMVLEFFEQNVENRINFSMSQNATLPITLISFAGVEKDGDAQLSWTVSQDSNPDNFELQQSSDGLSFSKIAVVKAAPLTTKYSYVDNNLPAGRTYYRMKMTDLNGKATYSQVVGIRTAATKNASISIYPTILTGSTLYVETGKILVNAGVTVSDVNGKIISRHNLGRLAPGQIGSFAPATGTLAKGMYFVQLNDGNELVATKRVVVQ